MIVLRGATQGSVDAVARQRLQEDKHPHLATRQRRESEREPEWFYITSERPRSQPAFFTFPLNMLTFTLTLVLILLKEPQSESLFCQRTNQKGEKSILHFSECATRLRSGN